ncbi:Hsp20/alpha crystallin family protein [Pseudomonas sp. C27(2019)]|uniref:Hsp20/alpha crystallin family protein n=1 Tax=Pseudomonas sp. C27(2019) TaxID=2604941 RepID=UPI0012470194|nr:Hsp20/alpha crystallin family protein [Pseudomonas sp. C27(2019)]QEY58906.1 Hsp20/alpha crystallin family protein [Pseudomonas sp. C27(2019)]
MSMFPARRRLFDELMGSLDGFYVQPLHGDPLPQSIKLDVQDIGEAYKVQAELPGVKKEDIHVDIDGAVVTIKAEIKQQDSSGEGSRNLRSERYYGSVSRRFELPSEIDLEHAQAQYEEGLLLLELPKRKAVENSRKLNIK